MASKIVSLLLQVKDKLSPTTDKASKSLERTKQRALELEKSLAAFEGAQAAVDSLDDVRKSAIEAEQAFDRAQLEVIGLKAELNANKTPELALALDKAKVSSSAAKKEWAATQKTIKNLEKTLKRAGVDVDDVAGSQARLTSELKGAQGALKANANRMEALRKKTGDYSKECKKATSRMGGFIAQAAGFLGVYTLVNKVQDAFRGLGRGVYESGIQFEKLEARLNDFEIGFIEEFARDVPFQLQETAEAFATLKTFGIDPMNGSLQAMSDQTAQLGGGQEKLNGIVTALGQAWGKQKLQQEEILQLIERGVPAWDLLSSATGKSTVELQKMSSAGQLGRKEIQLLIDAMGEASAGSAARQMATLGGLVSNLQDRFTSFYRMVADAGVFEYLKQQVSDVIAKFEEMANNGQLEKLAQNISDTFILGAEAVKSFALTVYELSGTFITLGQAWVSLKVVSWLGPLRNVTSGFLNLGQSADSASFSFKALATAARAAMGAFVVQQVFNVVSAYRELGVEVNKLDAAERAQVESQNQVDARYRNISESTGVLVTSMAELERQIRLGNIVIDEQSNKYLNAKQSADLYIQRQKELGAGVKAVVFDQDKLSQSMKNTSEALKDAADDNSRLAGVLNDQLLNALSAGDEGIGGFVLALKQAEQQGDLTAKQIDEGLVEAIGKLSDSEKQRWGESLKLQMEKIADGADGAGVKVEYLQRILNQFEVAEVESALKRLGITQEELTNKITDGTQKTLEDLKILDKQISILGTKNDGTAEAVFEALKKAIVGAKTEADELALSKAIDTFKEKGTIAKEQYDELKGSLEKVSDVAEAMGGEAAESLDKVAESSGNAKQVVDELANSAEESGHNVREAAGDLAEFFNGIKNSVYALSDAAGTAFANKLGINAEPALDEIESLQTGIDEAYRRAGSLLSDNVLAMDVAGVVKYKNSVLDAQSSVEIAYNSQKIKFLEYMEAIESGGEINQSFLNSAESSINNMGLLGKEDLAQLRSALDSANQKLQQMSDSAANTLDGLKNELDSLQGNQDAVQQRDYERKRAELQAAIEDAQLHGNKEAVASYTEALRVLDQLKKERRDQSKEQSNKQSSSSPGSNSVFGKSGGSTTTINLNSPSGGKSVQLQGDPDAVKNLLDVLEDANLRAG